MANQEIITLAQAKNWLRNSINADISLHNVRQSNLNNTDLVCDLHYLHIQIIFHSVQRVDHFLENYFNRNGYRQVRALLHMTIALPGEYNNIMINAMDCATLWSTDPEMVSKIYAWGGLPFTTVNGANFENNLANIPFVNYLYRLRLVQNDVNINNYPQLNATRNLNEFRDVIERRNWLASNENPYHPGFWLNNLIHGQAQQFQAQAQAQQAQAQAEYQY